MREEKQITGEVTNIIYSNDANGYKVIQIEYNGTEYCAVGYFHTVTEGETLKLTGKWVNHSTYGEQFKADVFEKIVPATRSSIIRYLASGIIKGVRESTAKKLVEHFGEDTLKIIENEYERLASIKGISVSKALVIHESYMQQIGSSALMMFLQDSGISAGICAKVYKKYGSNAVDLIKQNPYILCETIDGVGFRTADIIAKKIKYSHDSENRIRAGIIYTIKFYTQFGHVYLPYEILVKLSSELLTVDDALSQKSIDALINDHILISEPIGRENRIYYYTYYKCELYCADKIRELNERKYGYNEKEIFKQISIVEKLNQISFADSQKEAVVRAMQNSVLVITGGPGTGKTTIINAIIDIMRQNGLKVVLTAPTGRAAKRMSQVCSLEAKTIHRLLEAGYYGDDEMEFMVNEKSPIDSDVIIVDEMSMVDIVLLNNLLKAVAPGTRLIMVGDVNQLPSVGPGNVLKDIIDSGTVEVIRLTEIFRQASESMIVTNAHGINNGRYPECNVKDGDFYFAEYTEAAEGVDYIVSLCAARLAKAYGYDPYDIQVLSPAKKGIAGVYNLNLRIRDALNPKADNKNEKDFGTKILREGDKVMQIKNNYDINWTSITTTEVGSGVFNGDVGIIQAINNSLHTITVMYDDRKVVYDFRDVDEIELAYCITIHKSQGSEFPAVIMPMYDAPKMLITRNLFYTGVTRAKSLVVLVGKEGIIRAMVDNNREDKRYSGLKEKLIGNN